jgi:hypothetical protein
LQEGEAIISEVPAKTLQLDDFNTFLRTRPQLANVLMEFYAQSRTSHASNNLLFRKLKFSAYINKMKTDQKLVVC